MSQLDDRLYDPESGEHPSLHQITQMVRPEVGQELRRAYEGHPTTVGFMHRLLPLSEEALFEISGVCPVEPADEDRCLACAAYMESARREDEAERAGMPEDSPEVTEAQRQIREDAVEVGLGNVRSQVRAAVSESLPAVPEAYPRTQVVDRITEAVVTMLREAAMLDLLARAEAAGVLTEAD